MKKAVMVVAACAVMACGAGVPVKWSVETSRADERTIDVYHGESLDIEVTFKSYGQILELPTNEVAATFWQTNGMNTAYWRTNNVEVLATNGIMRTTFGPEQDVGAKTLRGFIGIPGQIYRAAFVLRFKDAPGYNVAIVEWPYRLLDFDTIEVHNAPYYSKSEADERINELAGDADRIVSGETMTNTLTEAAKLYARMDGVSNGRRFKESFGKQGSQYRGSGMRFVDEYYYGGLYGLDFGTTRGTMDEAHLSLWTQDLYGEEDETNEYFAVYSTLPVTMRDESMDGMPYVETPGMKLPGDYGQVPWFSLKRAVDAYNRIGNVFSMAEGYILHNWTSSEAKEMKLHHPTVGYVESAVMWVTNYIAKFGKVYGAKVAEKMEAKSGELLDAEALEEAAAKLTATSSVPVMVYMDWSSDWPTDDEFQPTQPVWSNGNWSVKLRNVNNPAWQIGPYSAEGSESATNVTINVDGWQTVFTRESRVERTVNAYGLAMETDITNTVTKAYVESLGIGSEETDPVWSSEKNGYATTGRVESVAGVVSNWEGYWDGTNVVFEVTNYYGNTSGEIPRLRIKELREGDWQTVWDEANKFTVCESNLLHEVSESNRVLKTELKQECAPRAWGEVTDKGTPNVVSNSVWMTSPETYFAGGTEYQRVAVGSGTICVLVDNGAGTYTAGEEGTFRFQDEGGTNYFGFAKSESYTIGCRTDGIEVEGTLVTLRYDVIMGGSDVPITYYRQSLSSGEWVQLNNSDGTAAAGAPYTVAWYQDGGSYYAAINCGGNPSGFFKAETSVAGDVVFETNMKARLGGGIECQNTGNGTIGVIRPTYNGSTVTWTWSAK